MNWLTVKAKLWAAGAFLLALIAGILRLRYVENKLDRVTKQRDKANAQIEQREKVDKSDFEINQKYSDLRREAKRDLKEGKMPDSLRNRNKR